MQELGYNIFGAGDTGTRELLAMLTELAIPHIFVDIRRTVETDGLDPIKFLCSRRLYTVPQVFFDEIHVGNYEAMLQHLNQRKAA